MNCCKEGQCDDDDDGFIRLLWDDILFARILPFLDIKDLFTLRGLSSKYKLLINSYFDQMKDLNLGVYSVKFNTIAFKVLAENCSQLKTIILPNCKWLTDDLIVPLFENNQYISKLVLNRCTNLTSVCLQPVIINCKDLKSLSLAGCNWLTVGCLESITLHQQNLVEVDFSDCKWVSNMTTINNFLRLSHSLKSLNLSKLKCVTDMTMTIIAHNAKKLETLNVCGCLQVTTEGVRFVIEYCHKLKALVCLGCPLVIPHVLRVKHRPNLRVLSDTPILSPHVLLPRINV